MDKFSCKIGKKENERGKKETDLNHLSCLFESGHEVMLQKRRHDGK